MNESQIEQMKHIVKFSGGAASAVVAKLVIDEYGHDDVILLYSDTKSEHPDADRFRVQVCKFLNHEMTVVADGRDLWELIEHFHVLPSMLMPYCTTTLKQRPADKFLKEVGDHTVYLGFSTSEIRRAQRAMARVECAGGKIRFPLIEQGISSDECKRIIRDDWRICLPEPYKYLEHNNCIPCFKAGSLRYWKAVAKHYPEQFERACVAEETQGGTSYTVIKGKTLRQIKEMSDQEIGMFPDEDTTPCMCAV
jgi:hypothetical protein